MDNYDKRTNYVEFFHAAKNLVEYSEKVKGSYAGDDSFNENNVVGKEAEVRLFLFLFEPDLLSDEEIDLVKKIGKEVDLEQV